MRCFVHAEKESVGVCKNCCKGLCPECVGDNATSLACRDQCEERVKIIENYLTQTVYKKANVSLIASVLLSFVMIGNGIFFFNYEEKAYGIFFGLVGLGLLLNGWRYLAKSKKR